MCFHSPFVNVTFPQPIRVTNEVWVTGRVHSLTKFLTVYFSRARAPSPPHLDQENAVAQPAVSPVCPHCSIKVLSDSTGAQQKTSGNRKSEHTGGGGGFISHYSDFQGKFHLQYHQIL